jgi:hypothetical protein
MSEQISLVERIDLVQKAVQEWLRLSACPKYLHLYPFVGSWVDPRTLISAHESNQRFSEEEIRQRWAGWYERAVAVETALAEHGQLVAIWLAQQQIPGAEVLPLFLGYREPQYAERVDPVLVIARTQALAHAGDDPTNTAPSPMTSRGDRNYAVGENIQVVEESEDAVLQAFFQKATGKVNWIALDKQSLIELSGYETAPRLLSGMKLKYPILAPAIDCPGKRGRGGLKVFVAASRKSRKK